jgi:hypothetical protein
VLRPGGLCLVTFAPSRSTTLYPLVNRVSARLPVPGLTRLCQYVHSGLEIERLLSAAGFERVELHARFFGPFVYVSRLSRTAAAALLRRWERIDERIARHAAIRDFANVFVAAARKPRLRRE